MKQGTLNIILRHLPVLARMFGCSLVLLTATACSFQRISDVEFASVETVFVKGMFPPEEFEWDGYGEAPIQLLKVLFSTKTDISSLAATQEYHITGNASFCGLRNGNQVRLGPTAIYLNEERVSQRGPRLQENMKISTVYHTYLPLHRKEETSPSIASPAFDLKTDPDDICFRVHGGNMLGMTFHSNTVVIPKEAVTEALEKLVKRPE